MVKINRTRYLVARGEHHKRLRLKGSIPIDFGMYNNLSPLIEASGQDLEESRYVELDKHVGFIVSSPATHIFTAQGKFLKMKVAHQSLLLKWHDYYRLQAILALDLVCQTEKRKNQKYVIYYRALTSSGTRTKRSPTIP